MKDFDTDLVEASYIGCCCEKCAMYRERVYSLSGRDSRFPKLPDFLLYEDDGCGIQLYAFIYGANRIRTRDDKELRGKRVIRHSNRPFRDDRTKKELAGLNEIMQQREAERQREQCRNDYDWLWEHTPEICPKSFSSYMRMRNANTENYRKIKEAAARNGKALK